MRRTRVLFVNIAPPVSDPYSSGAALDDILVTPLYIRYLIYTNASVRHDGSRARPGAPREGDEMNLEMFATLVIVGLLTGWLAGYLMKDGGHGRIWDLALGLIGSTVAGEGLTVLG